MHQILQLFPVLNFLKTFFVETAHGKFHAVFVLCFNDIFLGGEVKLKVVKGRCVQIVEIFIVRASIFALLRVFFAVHFFAPRCANSDPPPL